MQSALIGRFFHCLVQEMLPKFSATLLSETDACRDRAGYVNRIEIQEMQPSPQIYNEMREAVGWHILEPERAEVAIKHSLFCVCAVDTSRNNAVIGMGRVVGDGAAYFYI